MALFRGIQEYIALDANNITLVFDSGNIVNISGNIFLYPPQGHPILYNYLERQKIELTPTMSTETAIRMSCFIALVSNFTSHAAVTNTALKMTMTQGHACR